MENSTRCWIAGAIWLAVINYVGDENIILMNIVATFFICHAANYFKRDEEKRDERVAIAIKEDYARRQAAK